MTALIAGLLAHARDVAAGDRADLAATLRASLTGGVVLLETCHRVELFGTPEQVDRAAEAAGVVGPDRAGIARLDGVPLARHLISLAVGRSSTVLAEDQVLHQIRVAVAEARGRGDLPPALDRLLDLAMQAGRRARTWAPARRPSLADLAVEEGLRLGAGGAGPILVVGSGKMGGLAARAAIARGRRVAIASRSDARAGGLASSLGVDVAPFRPSAAAIPQFAGVVVALAGPWPLAEETAERLVASGAWVVDLSAPPAVDPALAGRLGDRYLSVDDLGRLAPIGSEALIARLDRLVEETLERYRRWMALQPERSAARALAERAQEARAAELSALWRRIPSLDAAERHEVERMAERLTQRLLRDPLERLAGDDDGRRRAAARELFGL